MDYDRLRKQLVAYCCEQLRSNMSVGPEDVAHDVLAAYLTSDISEDRALAWCFKQCWSRLGHLKRKLNRFPVLPLVTDDHTDPVDINEPIVTDRPLDDTQVHDRLEHLLSELSTNSERLMRLSLLGLNAIQIAAILSKPKNTVQSALTRAREELGLPIVEVHTSMSPRLRELLTDAQAVQVHCLLSPTATALVA
jgi:DNA-directed RNA polymerase specialized sigma24 family protein